jgi:hypothetical protein
MSGSVEFGISCLRPCCAEEPPWRSLANFSPPPDPLQTTLSDADDRVRLNHWLPPQWGIAPRIRIGQRGINTLWVIPVGAAALIVLVAVAQSPRELATVKAFIDHYPGIAQAAPSIDTGFPWWLQLQHFLNMFFMFFIIRVGLQILHWIAWRLPLKNASKSRPFKMKSSESVGLQISSNAAPNRNRLREPRIRQKHTGR